MNYPSENNFSHQQEHNKHEKEIVIDCNEYICESCENERVEKLESMGYKRTSNACKHKIGEECETVLDSLKQIYSIENKCYTCRKTVQKTLYCSQCKRSFYCSKPCQIADWKTGNHKSSCERYRQEMYGQIGTCIIHCKNESKYIFPIFDGRNFASRCIRNIVLILNPIVRENYNYTKEIQSDLRIDMCLCNITEYFNEMKLYKALELFNMMKWTKTGVHEKKYLMFVFIFTDSLYLCMCIAPEYISSNDTEQDFLISMEKHFYKINLCVGSRILIKTRQFFTKGKSEERKKSN